MLQSSDERSGSIMSLENVLSKRPNESQRRNR